MDLAYDHITEESLPNEEDGKTNANGAKAAPTSTLNADFQAAYSAFSSSPWASRLGGFLGNVVKQGGTVYKEAQQEVTALGQDASKGLNDLRATLASRTRGLSLSTVQAGPSDGSSAAASEGAKDKDKELTPTAEKKGSSAEETDDVLARIKDQASKRLRDLQQAEDAADEALIKFGTNVRNFLRDAISVAPPEAGGASGSGSGVGSSKVLFESKDAQGKRVVHASRFDAQLHVIHTNPDSFAKDPTANAEYTNWAKTFDIEKKTDDIAADLAKYPELRSTMEKLVPDKIPYADFWQRYYFLRHGIETAEARRRDLLAAASTEEEIGWDDDDEDDDDDDDDTDEEDKRKQPPPRPASTESSTTIQPAKKVVTSTTTTTTTATTTSSTSSAGHLKPSGSPRKSDEKSQADSDASYDMVGAKSGAPSQAPGSPREVRKADDDSSDEEDWE